MPKGKCIKCGAIYTGWALVNPAHRICKCGGEITIIYPLELIPRPEDK